ncbi:alpha/beta hydrolase [Mycolicibacterium sp. J2]|uniref:alpha/beta hydrolase n=1 Tax=Mycolicibacterium sp. J2 TaxID=2993511 RepID=UPI00224A60DE|nr:alpha/beta hydrolase [Mycolicibacterium sp. J2]MCX2715115.1 alpha/beta hydrolase [Mycolicibacterium sp. J2]
MPIPTVVLVHGAFADASTFQPVTKALLEAGIPVTAAAVPNRGLISDAAAVRAVVTAIDGPVLLVGHSYGGAVITEAGSADNVVALLYLAGYALAEGESLAQMQGRFPDSQLPAALVQAPYPPTANTPGGIDFTVDAARFADILAADVDPALASVLAVSQRPLAGVASDEPATTAAWRGRPTWGVLCRSDRGLRPEVQRFGYERAGAAIREVDSSHLVMLSQPAFVIDTIREILVALG